LKIAYGPPDQALRDAAASGVLDTDDGVRAEATRMLSDPRARIGVRAFVEDWLNLRQLDRMVKDPTVFVHASPDVGPAAREETVRVFQNLVFDEEADIRTLMTTRVTFVNRRLAAIYEVRAPREDFGRIELPEMASNLCFGGRKRNRLFITAHRSLYAIYLNTAGLAPGGPGAG
jgi:hypothetical protein